MKKNIKKFSIITLVFILVLAFTGCGETNKTTTNSVPSVTTEAPDQTQTVNNETPVPTQTEKNETPVPNEEEDELSSNLFHILMPTENRLVMCIKNTNSVDVDVNVGIEYYDGDTYIDHFENSVAAVKANGEAYVTLRNPRDFEGALDDDFYSNCRITVKGTRDESTKNYNDQLIINVQKQDINNETGEIATIEVTNNSDVKMSLVDLIILFYKGDTVVGAMTTVAADIPPKETRPATFLNLTTGENLETADYDTYEVLIQNAEAN